MTEARRKRQAQLRFGKGKGAADWIPAHCTRPVNCGGLVRKVVEEAREMAKNMGGVKEVDAPTEGKPLEFDLSFEDDVVFCTDGQIDICDLTGCDTSKLLGNDMVLDEDGAPQPLISANELHELSVEQFGLDNLEAFGINAYAGTGEVQFCECCGVFQPEDDFPDADEDVQNANHCISCNELASWGGQ